MTVAKGLTSGYVPMGAVFMSDRVYGDDRGRAQASPPWGTDIPIRPIRSARRSGWRCCGSTRRSCWKTAGRRARG